MCGTLPQFLQNIFPDGLHINWPPWSHPAAVIQINHCLLSAVSGLGANPGSGLEDKEADLGRTPHHDLSRLLQISHQQPSSVPSVQETVVSSGAHPEDVTLRPQKALEYIFCLPLYIKVEI